MSALLDIQRFFTDKRRRRIRNDQTPQLSGDIQQNLAVAFVVYGLVIDVA